MSVDRLDLEALFAPPDGLHGTHALLCGLSAQVPVLQRVLAAFTQETPVQREASGLIRGLLLLDASHALISPTAVPGLMHLAPCTAEEWAMRTTLLHAKVALLGFGTSRCGAPERWRLIVGTGNWTDETWSRSAQIDFFWSTEWGRGEEAAEQRLSDVSAAFDFFSRLLDRLYGDTQSKLAVQPIAVEWLDVWRKVLFKASRRIELPPARFIHTLDNSIAQQVRSRFPATGVNTLVAGSGFYEQATMGSTAQPDVLRELEGLGNPGTRFLVINRKRAGQISNWVGKLNLKDGRIGRWQLCDPRDPLQRRAKDPARTDLHGKFVAGLGPIRDEGQGRWSAKIGFLYLGSGNLTVRGYTAAARLGGRGTTPFPGALGNVEAGVVLVGLEKEGDVFRRLACGEYVSGVVEESLTAGDGEDLFVPKDPPPLLFARSVEQPDRVSGRLELERSAVVRRMLWLQGPGSESLSVDVDCNYVPWPLARVPAVLRVRDAPFGEVGQEWEIPVFSADGLFCKRAVPQLPFASVLKALLEFPAVPSHATEGDDDENSESSTWTARQQQKASPYPLRSYASMIEAIANRNEQVTPEEFPYWMSQLRVLLLEQAGNADRDAVRSLGVDLFPALMEPGFKPRWLERDASLSARYDQVVDELRAGWCSMREVK
jgi:hypothetical protein